MHKDSKLYAVAGDAEDVERFRSEMGAVRKGAFAQALADVKQTVSSAFKHQRFEDEEDEYEIRAAKAKAAAAERAVAPQFGVRHDIPVGDGAVSGAGGDPHEGEPHSTPLGLLQEHLPEWMGGLKRVTEADYKHNLSAANELAVPWCWEEGNDVAARHILSRLKNENAGGKDEEAGASICYACGKHHTSPFSLSPLVGRAPSPSRTAGTRASPAQPRLTAGKRARKRLHRRKRRTHLAARPVGGRPPPQALLWR